MLGTTSLILHENCLKKLYIFLTLLYDISGSYSNIVHSVTPTSHVRTATIFMLLIVGI